MEIRNEQSKQEESKERETKRKSILFYTDVDDDLKMLEFLKKQDNISEYIKGLVLADMKNHKRPNKDFDNYIKTKAFENKVNAIVEERVKIETSILQEQINRELDLIKTLLSSNK